MTREEVLDLITPRQFVEELENFDPAHMMFDLLEFKDDLIECRFNVFSDDFLNTVLEYNTLIYDTFKCDDLTFKEKWDYYKKIGKIFKEKEYEEKCKTHLNVFKTDYEVNITFTKLILPLLYKKNNICKFHYIMGKKYTCDKYRDVHPKKVYIK